MRHQVTAFLALFCLLLAGCAQHTDQTIVIGGAFALSGDAADWGQGELDAAQLAIEEFNAVNDLHVLLVAEDTATDGTKTLTAIRKLIDVDGVQAIIGPSWGDSYASIVAPVGEEHKIVMITPSGAIETAEADVDYPYFFSTYYPQKAEIGRSIEFLQGRGVKRIAIVRDEDPFNTQVSGAYADAARAAGIEVTETHQVPLGTRDFRTTLVKIQQQDPDAIFVSIFEIAEIGGIAKTMRELGMEAIAVSTISTETDALTESYADVAEGTVYYSFPDTSSAAYQAFSEKYTQKYGRIPTGTASASYDATNAILLTIKDGARTGEQIKDALYGISMQGVLVDPLTFTAKGQIGSASFVMKTVEDGKTVVVQE
jgi:branched-chain amino acid transport system substrate-binding protein